MKRRWFIAVALGLAALLVGTRGRAQQGTPQISTVLNSASFAEYLSPGALATIFGAGLSSGTTVPVSVTVNGLPAAVILSTASQLNLQLPVELSPGPASLQVSDGTSTSTPFAITLDAYAPGIFSSDGSGSGPGLFMANDGSVITDSHTAKTGDIVTMYVTGLGPTNPVVATGVQAPAAPPAVVTSTPTVRVAGTGSELLFAGLSPGTIGIYAVNFRVPVHLAAGTHPVILEVGGRSSNTVTLPVGRLGDIMDPAFFVAQLYFDLLGRVADPGGLNYWAGEIGAGRMSRGQVGAQFFNSQEFRETGLYIINLYIAVLGRDPDFEGWKFWFDNLRLGTPREAALNAFLSSMEFQARYGSLSNAEFVSTVYRNVLGRDPDSAGLSYWLGLLDSGTLSRAALMSGFVGSAEFDALVRSRSNANLLYMGFLRRTADPAGVLYWTSVLSAGTPLADAVNGFIISDEYAARF